MSYLAPRWANALPTLRRHFKTQEAPGLARNPRLPDFHLGASCFRLALDVFGFGFRHKLQLSGRVVHQPNLRFTLQFGEVQNQDILRRDVMVFDSFRVF